MTITKRALAATTTAVLALASGGCNLTGSSSTCDAMTLAVTGVDAGGKGGGRGSSGGKSGKTTKTKPGGGNTKSGTGGSVYRGDDCDDD